MIDQKRYNRYGDVEFVTEHPHLTPRQDAKAETPLQVAERYITDNMIELGLAESRFLGESQSVDLTESALSNTPLIRYSYQKDLPGAAVVVFDQYIMDLPIFGARLGVQIDETAMAAIAAQSSMHSQVGIANRDAFVRREEPQALSPAELSKTLAIHLETPSDARINRQVVYRYEEDERVDFHEDSHEGCFGGHYRFTVDLPATPAHIADGTHYIVDEILFRAACAPGDQPVNWRALVEPTSNAVLYIRALVAQSHPTGMVFAPDPQTQSGTTFSGASSDEELNPFRSSVGLLGLNVHSFPLKGQYVRMWSPNSGWPNGEHPELNYNVRSDHFAMVNAYVHCDNMFRTMDDYGFDVSAYHNGTAFPILVYHDHPDFNAAMVAANADSDGTHAIAFGKMAVGQVVGMATSNRVAWHEFGHVLLLSHVHAPNFGFAHSAGDALAAVMNDPGSRALDRFATFPWVDEGAPFVGRMHNRSVADGWAWFGPKYNVQYGGEQILASTLFRFYRSIGGDAESKRGQMRASQTTAYLIFKAIGLLTSKTLNPEVFVTCLQNADLTTTSFKDIPGGALHKVVRWAFEKQGLFQPGAEPGAGNSVTTEGNPPHVDVFIDDGRSGEYSYQESHWSCQDIWVRHRADGGMIHQPAEPGAINYMYVVVKNRGTGPATNVSIEGYHCAPGAGMSFPDDWTSMGDAWRTEGRTPTTGSIPPGGQVVVGPIAFKARRSNECLLAIVHAVRDSGNRLGLGPTRARDSVVGSTWSVPGHTIPNFRFVPFDNNIAQRNVTVMPSPRRVSLLRLYKSLFLMTGNPWPGFEDTLQIHNPFNRTVGYRVDVDAPNLLPLHRWSVRVSTDGAFSVSGAARHEIEPRGSRKLLLRLERHGPFAFLPRFIFLNRPGSEEPLIRLRLYIDGELAGGMDYRLR